ncbi:MinD superfamily P-loop ATPase [Acetoanaerobium pronyense]|uniref:MinD superfamily P-loop ATPase n=1 Tax=Acetoanaerobium pronyense TaxID=1482736 RepID=A0ABS4KHN1_9FIRM|nr:ATP-binding protein [Acetoanaerobium pronyense]MBP2026766.1 MinD superfamily P-loop ATPase [Acetoanaerobium pronyense]
MKVAILSGKGGAGKTMVAVNMAYVSDESVYLDCDVEEPNGNIFLKNNFVSKEKVKVYIPHVDQEKCSGCRTCTNFCRFNALAMMGEKIVVFEEICHSCGGCTILCPQNAISEKDKIIGTITRGYFENVEVISGELNIGEPSGVPLIKKIIKIGKEKDKVVIIDCPPGSSCSVIEGIKDADYCLIVTEPTIFGSHNLEIVHKLAKLFKKPVGIILNKDIDEKNPSEEYANKNNLKIIGKIPFNNKVSKMVSNGQIISKEDVVYKGIFENMLYKVRKEVDNETTSCN